MKNKEEQEREDRFIIIRFDILTDKNLTPSEKLVYSRICGFKKYFESKEVCSEMLGVSKDTVIKAKQKLIKLGYIRELENTGHGKIYQPVYDVETRVVKSTNQSGKEYDDNNITPPSSAAPTNKATELGYEFCKKFNIPILNNTVFRKKMVDLSKLMGDDSVKINNYFNAITSMQGEKYLDDPYCPKILNSLDIYGKYGNVKAYYSKKMQEKNSSMSMVAELVAKQSGGKL